MTRGDFPVALVLFALLVLGGGLGAGCSGGEEPNQAAGPTNDPNTVAKGAALYGELCSVCHGSEGQGGNGPPLAGFSRGAAELTKIIAERMPPAQPGSCSGDCATDVAAFILSGFSHPAPVCSERGYGRRQLRLLTRREYKNTLATLFGWDDASCPPAQFVYRPDAGTTPKSVHVAGTMNGWAATVAAGGWPLTWNSADGTWSLRRPLAVGSYQYKFVIDEKSWVVDAQNPDRVADGYGGFNSQLTVTCQAKGPPAPPTDVTAAFPPDTRPDGFAFDDSAEARLVTALHVDAYRQAGFAVAQAVAGDLSTVVTCDSSGDKAKACAADFVASFGARAFRRPLLPSEVTRYQALILSRPTFSAGVTLAIAALLQSPNFLYRSELGEQQPDGNYRLTSYEVASALSYLYWGTMPDRQLFAAASRDELGDPVAIEREARRLLADPRARRTIGDFALAWLGVERVLTVDKRSDLFPSFGDSLRQDLSSETAQFVASVVFDGSGQLSELFGADYSFLNESLAKLYGISGVVGSGLRKQPYGATAVARAGLLGHGSVLASYAYSDQTSPIRRGLFVRRSLLCQELPTPPPNAGGVPKVDPKATTRERFRQHSDSPFCRSCHQFIDAVGFGFESFDAIGMSRLVESGQPVDSRGDMNDLELLGSQASRPYASLPELGAQLAASSRASACFVRQYLRYARGQHEDVAADLCTLDRLQRLFRDRGQKIPELLVGVATLPELLYRSAP